MADSTGRTDNHAATLAAALSARIGVLADAARDTMIAIERDRSALEGRYGSSVMADELISAVRGRIEGVAGDCNDLAVILDRFKSLAGPTEVTEVPGGGPTIPAPFRPRGRSPACPPFPPGRSWPATAVASSPTAFACSPPRCQSPGAIRMRLRFACAKTSASLTPMYSSTTCSGYPGSRLMTRRTTMTTEEALGSPPKDRKVPRGCLEPNHPTEDWTCECPV